MHSSHVHSGKDQDAGLGLSLWHDIAGPAFQARGNAAPESSRPSDSSTPRRHSRLRHGSHHSLEREQLLLRAVDEVEVSFCSILRQDFDLSNLTTCKYAPRPDH